MIYFLKVCMLLGYLLYRTAHKFNIGNIIFISYWAKTGILIPHLPFSGLNLTKQSLKVFWTLHQKLESYQG